MLIHATKPLFPWDELDVSPAPAAIREALRATPDAQLLAAPRERRHDGCGGNGCVGTLVEQARADRPAERIRTLAYDKAADDANVHERLHGAGSSR